MNILNWWPRRKLWPFLIYNLKKNVNSLTNLKDCHHTHTHTHINGSHAQLKQVQWHVIHLKPQLINHHQTSPQTNQCACQAMHLLTGKVVSATHKNETGIQFKKTFYSLLLLSSILVSVSKLYLSKKLCSFLNCMQISSNV